MSFESQIIEMPRLDKYLLSVSLSSNDNLYINCKMWLKKKKKRTLPEYYWRPSLLFDNKL